MTFRAVNKRKTNLNTRIFRLSYASVAHSSICDMPKNIPRPANHRRCNFFYCILRYEFAYSACLNFQRACGDLALPETQRLRKSPVHSFRSFIRIFSETLTANCTELLPSMSGKEIIHSDGCSACERMSNSFFDTVFSHASATLLFHLVNIIVKFLNAS